jgi:8-oxo-dGTP pyrophosphatase MutT (NUDIX family)
MDDRIDFIARIEKVLRPVGEFGETKDPHLRSAAVLVPLIWENGQWNLLFIHRAETGEFHGGQVAFPGGGRENGDKDIVETALREVEEELHISPKKIHVLGGLPSRPTISRYLVTPVVGIVDWPLPLILEAKEVTRAFTIPATWLDDPNHWSNKEFEIPGQEKRTTIFFDEFDHELLWGLTAHITLELLQKV